MKMPFLPTRSPYGEMTVFVGPLVVDLFIIPKTLRRLDSVAVQLIDVLASEVESCEPEVLRFCYTRDTWAVLCDRLEELPAPATELTLGNLRASLTETMVSLERLLDFITADLRRGNP